MHSLLPVPVLRTFFALKEAGFEAHIVGGCVRDIILGRIPKDWDITTDATPEKIQSIFPDHVYENTFGTVGVKTPRFHPNTPDHHEHDIVEVTTYRTESGYSDKRRPDTVTFVTSLEEDLARRDFTINAIAGDIALPENCSLSDHPDTGSVQVSISLIDPFRGKSDLEKKSIRAVGSPEDRFQEDALRMLRAIRFASELRDPEAPKTHTPWHIEAKTLEAIKKLSSNLSHISAERIRDEFSRILLSQNPAYGTDLLRETGLLHFIIPELEEGIGIGQNLHHIYTVWEHNLRALETCPSKKLHVRLSALLHDVGKPRTKRGNGYYSTFYNHDHVGARMTRTILTRLKYPKDIIEKTTLLVDNHLFYYNVGEVTEASVRRLVQRVGIENMPDLLDLRIADRLGSGVPKAKPYKLRHLEYMIEKVSRDPLSVKMLKINGQDLMTILGLKPGPKIGALLDVLLAEVIEDPKQNTKEILLERSRTLMEHDLEKLRSLAKERIEAERKSEEEDIKKKHYVE